MRINVQTLLTLTATAILLTTAVLPVHPADPHGLPLGTYTTIITAQDIPPSFPPEFIPLLVGIWQIEYVENGTAIATKDAQFVVKSTFISNTARLVVHDEEGALACLDPGTQTGIYGWTFQSNQLVLTATHDACPGRAFVLTAHPWQKQ